MKRVTAYKALDGSLHETKSSAAGASVLYLGKTLNNDQRGASIDACSVAFLIKNRSKILPILNEIDAPEGEAM